MWDYAWLLSSELLVAILVIVVAVFNLFVFHDEQINDQSLTNKFLGYHTTLNPELYKRITGTKTLVIQQGGGIVPTALASEGTDTPPPAVLDPEPDTIQNDNTLVAQNPDSISQLIKRQVKVYKTQAGDTLGGIARKFGITIDTIIQANNLGGVKIDPNWDLLIPQTDGLIIEAGPNTTLSDIANKYKGNLDEIVAYNGLANAEDIEPGDYIFCKGCIVPVIPPKQNPLAIKTGKKQIGIADDSVPVGPGGHTFPKGQCTYYVAKRVKITFGGNAKNWLTNAKAAGYETDNAAAPGDVVVTTDSPYGHVAYVEQVTADYIVIKEMNFVGWNKVSSRKIPIDSKTIRGYITPKY